MGRELRCRNYLPNRILLPIFMVRKERKVCFYCETRAKISTFRKSVRVALLLNYAKNRGKDVPKFKYLRQFGKILLFLAKKQAITGCKMPQR
jgi:hypothetical protein